MLLAHLASILDAVHALLMVAWVAGLPLLFLRGRPKLTRWYGLYALSFVLLSQASHFILGGCFLTALSRDLWHVANVPGPSDTNEWFTIRFASWVFGFTPSHRSVIVAFEALTAATALGVLNWTRLEVVPVRIGRSQRTKSSHRD